MYPSSTNEQQLHINKQAVHLKAWKQADSTSKEEYLKTCNKSAADSLSIDVCLH